MENATMMHTTYSCTAGNICLHKRLIEIKQKLAKRGPENFPNQYMPVEYSLMNKQHNLCAMKNGRQVHLKKVTSLIPSGL
jgi:hypothetical protein